MRISTYKKKLLKQTREFAENKAKELSGKKALRKRNKKHKAKKKFSKQLYDKISLGYGFDECISSGNYGPFPHEIEKKSECFNFAVYQYFIAEAFGLNPRLFNVYGICDDNPNGKMLENSFGSYNHSFIDVDVGAKKRVMIDTQLRMHGFVDYDLAKRSIKVKDNVDTSHTKKKFKRIEEMTVDDIVDKLMFLRSAKGAGEVLCGGQRTGKMYNFAGRGSAIHYKYDKKRDSLESHIVAGSIASLDRDIIKRHYLDDKGDVIRETVQFGVHSDQGWCEYENQVIFGEFDVSILENFYGAIDNLVKERFSDVKYIRRMDNEKLSNYLTLIGVSDFNIDSSKLPNSIKTKEEIKKTFRNMEEVVEEEFERLIKKPDNDLFKKGLARRELYFETLDKRIANGTDFDGYIYCQNSRDTKFWDKEKEFFELFDKWQEREKELIRKSFQYKRIPQPDIKNHRGMSELSRKMEDLNVMIRCRRKRKGNYDFENDLLLYVKNRLSGISTYDLLEKVEKKGRDIKDSYKKVVFENLLYGYQGNYLLSRREHLPKLLKKMREYKAYCYLKKVIDSDFTRKREKTKMLGYINNPGNASLLPDFAKDFKAKMNED